MQPAKHDLRIEQSATLRETLWLSNAATSTGRLPRPEHSSLTAMVRGVAAGNTADYYVKTLNSSGEGPASNVVSVAPS
ncbi:hypothetical protein [Stutzerimonas degradans]|uniref:hypothetical protein n=1 Tax=Stutzerimonas degradans TaxID=2968968 RepID=UPI001422EF5F|nr:hypothetical protein [Stutzerimonas degradans]NHW01917.1 hypothetical protein [Stutzerimonas degradans]